MKTYKHIPTGRIYNMDYSRDNRFYFTEEVDAFTVPRAIVESGEDWEEVKDPPTFEVMSLATDDAYTISTFDAANRRIYENKNQWIKYYLESKLWNIYSVKRLSDGEIFTIGDYGALSFKHGGQKITKLEYIPKFNKIVAHLIANTYELNSLVKIKTKEKLFTTEDGVDMYAGNTLFLVTEKDTEGGVSAFTLEKYDIGETYCRKDDSEFDKLYKAHNFGIAENAENFIIMNKPCLSINDVSKIYDITAVLPLKEFVKSKL